MKMEDVVLKIPTSDMTLVIQIASRMGWDVVDTHDKPINANPYSWEEARERLAVAKEQFRAGQFQQHQEVIQQRQGVAV